MELKDQIINDINNNPIILYMKGSKERPMCGFSARVVNILNNHSVVYHDVNILESSNEYNIKYHIGVYAYRFDILQSWYKLSSSQLEQYESLEQLRWRENDIPIYAFEYRNEVLSIDNISQLEYARKIVSN